MCIPFSNRILWFLPQPASSMSLSDSIYYFDLQPESQRSLSKHDYSQTDLLSNSHSTSPSSPLPFSIIEPYPTHCSQHGSPCPSQNLYLTFFQAPMKTGD